MGHKNCPQKLHNYRYNHFCGEILNFDLRGFCFISSVFTKKDLPNECFAVNKCSHLGTDILYTNWELSINIITFILQKYCILWLINAFPIGSKKCLHKNKNFQVLLLWRLLVHTHTNIYLNPVPSVFSGCSSASMPKHSILAICISYRKWQFACLPLTFRENKWNKSNLSSSPNPLNPIF